MRIVVVLLLAGIVVMSVAAQTDKGQRAEIAGLIEGRLRAGQPVELTADSITLTGDVLRLDGHATVSFDDTSISAQQATLSSATKTVVLGGDVMAHLGRKVTQPGSKPRIEYR